MDGMMTRKGGGGGEGTEGGGAERCANEAVVAVVGWRLMIYRGGPYNNQHASYNSANATPDAITVRMEQPRIPR